jgi:hypothetical protein
MGWNMAVTNVVVNDTKLFGPTGDVRRWADKVAVKFTVNAKAEAPTGAATGRVNKTGPFPVGSLKRNIYFEVTRVGPRQLVTTISVQVPYAMYVLKGTGTIYAKRNERGHFPTAEGGLYIPANPGWGKSLMRQRVRGQKANPFLDRAYARTARSHPSLRGFKFTV